MRKEIKQLLIKLTDHYPLKDDQLEAKTRDFTEILFNHCFNKGYKYNFNTIYTYIIEHHEKGYPSLAQLKDYMASGIERDYKETIRDGEQVVITLPNGYTYRFEIAGYGKTINQIKGDIQAKYGSCKVDTYPKGTVIIGDKVFS